MKYTAIHELLYN